MRFGTLPVAAQRPSPLLVSGLVGAGVYLVVLAWAVGHASYDTWAALIIAPVIVGLTYPVVYGAARRLNDPWITKLIMAALSLKLVGSGVRYFVAFSIYGRADAAHYDKWGRKLAPLFRDGVFSVDLGRRVMGTGFIQIVTGVVYVFTGATRLGGFLVFSWLGFWGLFLFYLAFRTAFPGGDHRRYAILLFFMPSLLFWPSSIGKESWMMFVLGIAAYGTARVLVGKQSGYLILGLGLLGTQMVRPHVTLILILSVIAAYFIYRPEHRSVLTAPAKVVGLVVLMAAALIIMSRVETFFGVQRLDTGTTEQVLNKTENQTSQGGSEYKAERPRSPVGLANAVIAVFFRPWPNEAHNAQLLMASAEGLVLLGLMATSLRRIAAIPREAKRTPYVAFALVYTLLFVYAFSSIGNFGILARERVQLFPLLLLLLCVQPRPALGGPEEAPPTTARLETAGRPERLSYRR